MKNYIEFSRPFINALQETLSKMGNIHITSIETQLKKTSSLKGDITALIGMNGQRKNKLIKGSFLISWDEEVYVKMAGRILMEEYSQFCHEISDTGAEICNIVMGNAKRDLVELGYKIEMATPNTILGKNHTIQTPPNVSIIEISLQTEIGEFQVELCYLEV